MKSHQILLALLFICLSSCKDTGTQNFSQIANSFGLTIPDTPHTFVVLPYHSCTMCVKLTWTILENEVDSSKKITIIDAYRNGKDPFQSVVSFPVYIDSNFIVENSSIGFTNPTIIHTDKGRVKSIVSTPSNKTEEILRKELDSL